MFDSNVDLADPNILVVNGVGIDLRLYKPNMSDFEIQVRQVALQSQISPKEILDKWTMQEFRRQVKFLNYKFTIDEKIIEAHKNK